MTIDAAASIFGGAVERKKISQITHPYYAGQEYFWRKWRLAYIGGKPFRDAYLKKLSKREDDEDFKFRKEVSYSPSLAKAAINDIRNGIYQRMIDVTREGGDAEYQKAVKGLEGGIDMRGNSMNSFIGLNVIPELLPMSRVGVFVDMPELTGPTKADKKGKRPYIYLYRTESIRSWLYDDSSDDNEFLSVVLQDENYELDLETGLPIGSCLRFRHIFIDPEDGFVHVCYYDSDGTQIDHQSGSVGEYEVILKIRKVPFVLFEISESLMTDIADYQIALLNLASSDINYSIKANFPFYTEQYDSRTTSPYLKGANPLLQNETQPDVLGNVFQTAPTAQENVAEIRVGVTTGRRYAIGVERPGFIHPSSEPLIASMQKQQQLKSEIRQLLNLSIQNLQPVGKTGSPSDSADPSVESGMSYIGMALEHGERKIAEFWAMYQGTDAATVSYPENYALTTDEERHTAAKDYIELMPNMPSLTYQREIAKQVANIMLRGKVPTKILHVIQDEIDKSPVVMGDPKVIASDIEQGLVSLETASTARGYPEGEVEKAKSDHAERLARIATSQAVGKGLGAVADTGQARGVSDLGGDPNAGKTEKKVSVKTTHDPVVTDKTRGEGK